MLLAVLWFLIPVPPTEGHWLNRWALGAAGVLAILGGLTTIAALVLRHERSVIGLVAGLLGSLWIVVAVGEFGNGG